MNPITSQTAQDSFLLRQTATSIRSDPVLQLGKKIVQELGLEQSVDTLTRWMAHYIAELIQSAETASAEDRPDKMARCAEAILELWKHRSALPNGKRPFEDIEPILQGLESLDPHTDGPRYFRPLFAATHKEQELVDTAKTDDSARKEIENRLQRLDAFIQLAKTLSSDLHARLV